MKPIKTPHAFPASSVSPLRRGLLALPLAAAAWPLPTLAQFRVEISGVGATQLPIAVAKPTTDGRCGSDTFPRTRAAR